MNHKRRRPKHQRAGCLLCKPHKDERRPQRPSAAERRQLIADALEHALRDHSEILRRLAGG